MEELRGYGCNILKCGAWGGFYIVCENGITHVPLSFLEITKEPLLGFTANSDSVNCQILFLIIRFSKFVSPLVVCLAKSMFFT